MIAISQPTYLPWPGYFSLIYESKKFIFLDDVQLNSRSWQQRNRILNNDKINYLTVPIRKKGQREQLINKSLIEDKTIFEKHLEIIRHCYSKCNYFKEYFSQFEKIFLECKKFKYISDINIFLIRNICEILKLESNFDLSSKIKSNGKKTDKLVSICEVIQENKYLTNEGAMVYLNNDLDKFKKKNISLYKLNIKQFEYNQRSTFFKENLSIIDVIFNEGPNSANIIKNIYYVEKVV